MTALYRRRYVDGLSTSASVRHASLDRLRALRVSGASAHPSIGPHSSRSATGADWVMDVVAP
jgi:hypothetical protein